MNRPTPRGTLLELPLIQERYGPAFIASIAIHSGIVAFFLVAPFLMPRLSPIQIGTGPGGGTGGESYTVGVADNLGGGAGLIKPATSLQPPALPVEKPAKKEIKKQETETKAVPLPEPGASKNRKKAVEATAKASKSIPASRSSQIPVPDAKGAGGSGGTSGGSGGGSGGGVGVSIGAGAGGLGDSWYARVVEARIGQAWIKPIGVQGRIEIVYSFLVADDGRIYGTKLEKSSGNDALDLTALRAINSANPLAAPPPELRSRSLQFTCQFVYPPDKEPSIAKE